MVIQEKKQEQSSVIPPQQEQPSVEQQKEQVITPEQQVEQPSVASPQQEQPSAEQQVPATTIIPTTTQDTSNQEIILENVENILSKGLDNIFLTMDQATQITFKTEGERAAKEITSILQKTKFKVKEIIDVIFKWLRIIPQVNKYYIEQEAKIKADVIMELHKNK